MSHLKRICLAGLYLLAATAAGIAVAQTPARENPALAKQVVLPPVPPPAAQQAGTIVLNLSASEMTMLEWIRVNDRKPIRVDDKGNIVEGQKPTFDTVQAWMEWQIRGYIGTDPRINQAAFLQFFVKNFGPEAQQRARDAAAAKKPQ